MEHFIHKVNITEEAEFDVECLNALSYFNKKETKEEIEYFIYKRKEFHNKRYFRLRDYLGDKEIIYFIRRGVCFANMQIWNLIGICEIEDWNEELELCGMIRNWYETKINPETNERDWVEELRERQILEERERKKDEEEQAYYERLFNS